MPPHENALERAIVRKSDLPMDSFRIEASLWGYVEGLRTGCTALTSRALNYGSRLKRSASNTKMHL